MSTNEKGSRKHCAATAEPKSAAEKARERGAAMRASIAAAMSRSKREIPHYYLADEIVLDTALAWLTEQNASRGITERILPAVLQLKAVGLAARKFGEFNGFWRDDGFEPASGQHVGVAISLRGGGLVAPAIHDVSEKKLGELMADPVRKLPAALFYFAYPMGVMALALVPAPGGLGSALLRSALVGLVAYGTYDLTCLAVIRNYPVSLALVDIVWGTVLSAAAGVAAYVVMQRF